MLNSEHPESGVLKVSGELTIFEAAEFHALLSENLGAHPALTVDLSGVTELDSSGVQVMLVAQRGAAARQQPLSWVAHSAAVRHVLERLNLDSVLGEPVSIIAD